MALTTFKLTLASTKTISPSVRHLAFARDDGLLPDFIPGQFLTLLIPSSGDDKPKRRSYSLATIPNQSEHFEIAVGEVPGGIATQFLFAMQPGDSVEAFGPVGRLILPIVPPRRVVLVATGTGVTPYRSMLPTLAEQMKTHDMHVELLFGCRTADECLYKDEFLAFAKHNPTFHYHACYSRETPLKADSFAYQGYVHQHFDSLDLKPAIDLIYLCGNPNMIDESFEKLTNMGFATADIKREKYISSK